MGLTPHARRVCVEDTAFNSLRIVMMGTGEFALPTFLGLYETSHQVMGLFTQPDREGRGHHHHPHPMKEAALAHNTPVFQPDSINTPESLEILRELKPDVCLVAAYGQILSRELLEIPRLGAFNVHASLLPKYRGAAPIQHAIWKGETETGVTIFRIEPKLDAGPIAAMQSLRIGDKETYGELQTRLADLAAPLSLNVIEQLAQNRLTLLMQNPQQATRAPRLKKTDGEIRWQKSAEEISWHIRAMQPWPTAYTFFHQEGRKPVRLIVTVVETLSGPQMPASDSEHPILPLKKAPAGTVMYVDNHRLLVQTGEGLIEILELRPEGKRDMPAGDFLHGHSVRPGNRLGPERLDDE
jgi:methionyl-tRNA formyltransferase